jgi:hypothetical protein
VDFKNSLGAFIENEDDKKIKAKEKLEGVGSGKTSYCI